MKIKFLGTAAAEAFPAMFCDCENCKKAADLGGRNIRTRSQTLINSDLLIDYPCDTYYHLVMNKINLLDIKHCLITHTHSDHFYPTDFSWMRKGFSHPPESWKGLSVFGSKDILEPLSEAVETSQELLSATALEPFKAYKIGEYTVHPLKAVHGTENPFIYAIEKDNKALLYAHDTDILSDLTFEYLKQAGLKFNLVSMDCTEGAFMEIPYEGHMCLGKNIKCRELLKKYGLADEGTKFVLNHFSHNGENSVYEDFEKIASEYGFITSYDGLEIEF